MPYMLDDRHLMMAFGAAIFLHLLVFAGYHFAPKPVVKDIPIRTLNLRLGEVEEPEDNAQASSNAPAIEAIVDSVAREMVKKPDMQASAPKPIVKAAPKPAEPKQYVREVNMPNVPAALKNEPSAKEAEVMSRYTQLISLWIQKFKVYPDEARALGVEGSTMVRIRIDRKGNIRFYKLENTTGNEILDKAAIDMIKRANPVPAAPGDYPKEDLLEFLIPVSFSLL